MSEFAPQTKIIIDEDWKSRAQAEKEALRMKAEQERAEQAVSSPPPSPANAPRSAGQNRAAADDGPLPPPTFPMHLMSLASQAMVFLGQAPNPLSGEIEPHLSHARHLIDTLAMLEEKTAGNLSAEESRMLTGLLHELRLGFVEAQRQSQQDPT